MAVRLDHNCSATCREARNWSVRAYSLGGRRFRRKVGQPPANCHYPFSVYWFSLGAALRAIIVTILVAAAAAAAVISEI